MAKIEMSLRNPFKITKNATEMGESLSFSFMWLSFILFPIIFKEVEITSSNISFKSLEVTDIWPCK